MAIVLRTVLFLAALLGVCLAFGSGGTEEPKMSRLKVSENKRFIVKEDGTPFFYLGDTAWELFHRLNREKADRYLANRAAKKFTVIQAVVLAELNGPSDSNPYGHLPLIDNDPARPNEPYFQHVDYIVNKAQSLGLYIGMLPTWGSHVTGRGGQRIFNPSNGYAYGLFLGKRYRDKAIIWVLGGDRPADSDEIKEVWRAMAKGLKEGDEGKHLMTFHPNGAGASSTWFHNDAWLDFNMIQSGHSAKNIPNYNAIAKDYERTPTKPCMDGEPRYEDHPVNWNPKYGWLDEHDVRQAAYWALFAGAHGHTYGCHDIWQMYAPGRNPISSARTYWYDALDLPATFQMQHARCLLESRPFLIRVPDQSIIAEGQGEGPDHVQATRGADGSYAFVYIPTGKHVTVNMNKISGSNVRAFWYDPRKGTSSAIGEFPTTGTKQFSPASCGRGNDWVLVLDDASKGFPAPGASK